MSASTPAPGSAPIKPQPGAGLSKTRLALAFVVAAASDGISIAAELIPPVQLGVDAATVLVLLLILGFRWQLVPALIVEAIPGLALFPTWIAAVIAIIGFLPRQAPSGERVIDVTPTKRDGSQR